MPELILVIGLPGSGKSTWIRNKYSYNRIFNHDTVILASDEIRAEICGDENDQSKNEEVFATLKDRMVKSLINGQRVIVDATNLTRNNRQSIIDYAEQNISGLYESALIKFVVIATPYYKCLENNRNRSRQVPEEVIKRMYKNFEFPTYMETVHKIEIVCPFEVDKNIYGIEHPYENLLEFSHDTPYHRLTVGEHLKETYEIMKILSDDKIMLKAAELHDIGKPFCKKFVEEVCGGGSRARFLNHANVGSYEAIFYAKKAGFTVEETIELCNLIQFHMRIRDVIDNKQATRRLKNITGSKIYYKLQMLGIADKEAH